MYKRQPHARREVRDVGVDPVALERVADPVGDPPLLDQVAFQQAGVGRDHRVPAVLGLPRAQALPVEPRQCQGHHPERLRDVGRPQDPLDEGVVEHLLVGEEHFLLVGEVPEEGPGRDAGALRDLDGGRALETLLREQFHGGLLQPLLAALLPPWHGVMVTPVMTCRDNVEPLLRAR